MTASRTATGGAPPASSIPASASRYHLDMRRRSAEWPEIVRSALSHLGTDRVSVAAGAFAYRWFLSLFPIVIALLGLGALVTIPHHVVVGLVSGVNKALPAGAAAVVTSAITHADRSPGRLSTVVIAAAVALWSATSGMVMVEEGLDMAYGLPRDRSFLQKRLRALPLLVGSTMLGGGASALVVFGAQLGHPLERDVPVAGYAFAVIWTIVRWVVAVVLVELLFSLLYYLAPNRPRATWRLASPGALVATALWALISLGFSLYTSKFGSYTSTYGAFAGVAILIFWLYLTGVAIFLGAEIDAATERYRTPGARS